MSKKHKKKRKQQSPEPPKALTLAEVEALLEDINKAIDEPSSFEREMMRHKAILEGCLLDGFPVQRGDALWMPRTKALTDEDADKAVAEWERMLRED